MRVVSLVACAAFFAACGSASAADCSKGMLWPHVRNPGDCLTPTELQAGQKGAYAGPVNANVDVSAIKPLPNGQAAAASDASGGLLDDLFGGNSGAEGANGACTKGILWPFVRETGDCPTTAERRRNRVAQARAAADSPPGVPLSAPPPSPAPVPQEVAAPATAGAMPSSTASSCGKLVQVGLDLVCAPTEAAASCERRGIWPFRHYEGDCAAEAERK